MFEFLKLFINKKVTVNYVERGINKQVKGILLEVDDNFKAVRILLDDNAIMRLGFISSYSAIRNIRFSGIPIYNNSNIPPKYGYNPLNMASNINEKNKQIIKKFGKLK